MRPFIFKILILICTTILLSTAHARCVRSYTSMNTGDLYATPLNFGTINLSSAYLQPVGSVLGHIVVPPSHRGAPLSTVLWTCDEADLPNIYFLVATNGDEPFGGHIDIGSVDGLKDVYATWWKYVGLKQSMNDVVLTRYWKRLNINSYNLNKGKVEIRLMDIPPMVATLYRISSLPTISRGTFCNRNMIDRGSYRKGFLGTASRGICSQPSAYIQLSGDSNVTFAFSRDQIGEDSNTRVLFWGALNGFPYGFVDSSTTLSLAPTCVARNATPVVNLPNISMNELKGGLTSSAEFNVEVECNDTAVSGVEQDQVAIGFQPSNSAYMNAQKLGLIHSNGASNYLVSDDYYNEINAKGVGIQLQHSTTQTDMLFLNQFAISGGGTLAGWYPVLEGNPDSLHSNQPGFTTYLQRYKAILTKLPDLTPTPGKVKATATVVVKIQ